MFWGGGREGGKREREVTGLHLIMQVFTYVFVFVMHSILQSQFIEKAFKQTENSEQNVVLLLSLIHI